MFEICSQKKGKNTNSSAFNYTFPLVKRRCFQKRCGGETITKESLMKKNKFTISWGDFSRYRSSMFGLYQGSALPQFYRPCRYNLLVHLFHHRDVLQVQYPLWHLAASALLDPLDQQPLGLPIDDHWPLSLQVDQLHQVPARLCQNFRSLVPGTVPGSCFGADFPYCPPHVPVYSLAIPGHDRPHLPGQLYLKMDGKQDPRPTLATVT